MKNLWVAVSFMTRIPVRGDVSGVTEPGASAPWFPVVGLIVGIVGAGAFAIGEPVFGPALAAALAVAASVALTGAFHEDGLADTFDAFGGGQTAERRVQIMKDSRLGTFGTVALVAALGLQILAIARLGGAAAITWIVVAHVLSRSAALAVMATSKPVGGAGLGAAYLKNLPVRSAALGVGSGTIFSVVATIIGGVGIVSLIGVWIASAVGATLIRRWAYERISGVTGDVLGAVQQVTFTTGLLMAVAMTRLVESGLIG